MYAYLQEEVESPRKASSPNVWYNTLVQAPHSISPEYLTGTVYYSLILRSIQAAIVHYEQSTNNGQVYIRYRDRWHLHLDVVELMTWISRYIIPITIKNENTIKTRTYMYSNL